jgi:hypothetical protein
VVLFAVPELTQSGRGRGDSQSRMKGFAFLSGLGWGFTIYAAVIGGKPLPRGIQ